MQVKSYEVIMDKIKDETPNVKTFTLKFNEDFNFKPGHFIMIKHMREGKPKNKSYSIASSPNLKGCVELCINLVPGGSFTPYLFSFNGGEKLNISGPYGLFLLKEPYDYDFVFVATGTGIAPLRSMIHYLFENKIKRDVWLFFGNKAREDIIYNDTWEELAKKHKNFHYIPVLSREEWKGEKGHVQDIIPKYIKDYNNKHFYICGLIRMVDDVKNFLLQQNIKIEQLHYEKFV